MIRDQVMALALVRFFIFSQVLLKQLFQKHRLANEAISLLIKRWLHISQLTLTAGELIR